MVRTGGTFLALLIGASMAWCGNAAGAAATPTVEQALKLKPVHPEVEYEIPSAEEAPKCKISVRQFEGRSGWVVEDAQGQMLRRFVDTNGDNVVDQWSYFRDGIEVYRDIDSDFNGKPDQHRWFNTAGTRWGIDKNEDGRIDSWKQISAEEAAAEIVRALAQRDAERFALIAMTVDESKGLGLGAGKGGKLGEKVGKLTDDFKAMVLRQDTLPRDVRMAHFSGGKPGVVPAGTEESTRDLTVYEHVVAIMDVQGKATQVVIGTLVQIGPVWRAIDLPQLGDPGPDATAGFFFTPPVPERPEAVVGAPTEQTQKLIEELQKIDESLNRAANPPQRAQLVEKRAEVLLKIANQSKTPAERAMWYRQMADMLSGEVQSGVYPAGAQRLVDLFNQLKDSKEIDRDIIAHVRICQLTAEYGLAMQAPKPDFIKIQTDWLKNLEQFVAEYPQSPDAAEAMLQLGISQEFNGQEDAAAQWYQRIKQNFPNSPAAQKAAGAKWRLESVGKVLALSGSAMGGGTVDLAKFRGKPVLIHYWATWSEPAKADIATIQQLLRKYGNNLVVVGINLDLTARDAQAVVNELRVTWPQIWEEGGLDSRTANQLGILTVPTTLLLDAQGRVVNRAVASNEIEAEVKKVLNQ